VGAHPPPRRRSSAGRADNSPQKESAAARLALRLSASGPLVRLEESVPTKELTMRWTIPATLLCTLALGAQSALADTPLAFSGEITRLERGAKAVVVEGGEPRRKLTFFLARGAQVTNGGEPSSFGELKRGARVEISYTKLHSHLFARRVDVVGVAAAQAAAD
jgi:hypothetical protein